MDERHAVEKAREMIIHALMRPVNPKILEAPHEPVTLEYLQHQCTKHVSRSNFSIMYFGQKKHSKQVRQAAKQQALEKEKKMTYKEILTSRAKVFFHFLKTIPTVDNIFYPEEVDEDYLIQGIRVLCVFRLETHKGGHITNHHMRWLSDTFAHHLMRGIDTTGNRQLEEAELLEFLLVPRETKKKKAQEVATSDLHYRSVHELVDLLEKANQALKKAGIEDESSATNQDPTPDTPRFHIEKAKEELLAQIGE